MKKMIIITGILLAGYCNLQAQTAAEPGSGMNKKFVAAMEANLKMLDTASGPETFITLANSFERIGKAEQKQWQPYYYASFCYALMAANTPDKSKVDGLTEKAGSYLDLAGSMEKNNSEISCLRGMILYSRISVDPASRWQTWGREANEHLSKAKEQDPANPRPYLIEANAKLRTPEGLGGGPKATKPVVEECLDKFKTFVPQNSIAPVWGKAQAEKLLQAVSHR